MFGREYLAEAPLHIWDSNAVLNEIFRATPLIKVSLRGQGIYRFLELLAIASTSTLAETTSFQLKQYHMYWVSSALKALIDASLVSSLYKLCHDILETSAVHLIAVEVASYQVGVKNYVCIMGQGQTCQVMSTRSTSLSGMSQYRMTSFAYR